MPDPHILSGTTGGPISASNIPGQGVCRGYMNSAPNHVISSRTGFRNIRFVVQADRDATLVVILPNGQILCDDDGGEGVNPLIETSSPAGNIAVWVGAYSSSGQGSSYRMGVSELRTVTASNLGSAGRPQRPQQQYGGGVNANAPPLFGATALNGGFMPDPAIVSGTAGGPVPASQLLGSCRGHITGQPSHVLQTRTGFRNIRFVVNAGFDTTLTVMLPDGRIVCNDDGGRGSNPLVETNSPRGAIRIWVGSYSAGRTGPYNLGYSEMGSVGTAQIPAPGGGMVRPGPGRPVRPPMPTAEIVPMQAGIPVTLMGPGLSGTIAMWHPGSGPQTQIQLVGRNLVAGGVTLASIPASMRSPVVTVIQQRNGMLVARAEQSPEGRGDRGQQFLLQISFRGRPTVTNRWNGTAVQRGPRWSR